MTANGILAKSDKGSLLLRWINSVEEISEQSWDSCFQSNELLCSYRTIQALERSKLDGICFQHLVGEQELCGDIMCAVPCYLQSIPLEALAPSWVAKVFKALRTIHPTFMKISVLVVGTPLPSFFGLEKVPLDLRNGVLRDIETTLCVHAKQVGASLIAVKDLDHTKKEMLKSSFTPRLRIVDSLPEAFLRLYPQANLRYENRLRSRYRNMMRRRKSSLTQGNISWEIESDFANRAELIYSLYLQVIARTEIKFEVLTPEFFAQIANLLPKESFLIKAISPNNHCLAFALVVCRGDILYPLYIGLDYTVRDEFDLYNNLLYRIIEEAEARNCKLLWLGPFAYESKALIGASFRDLHLGLMPMSRAVSFVLRFFATTLFPKYAIEEHRVFKSETTYSG